MKTKKTSSRQILRQITIWRGLTEAAERLGVSVQHLSEIVHGNRAASPAIARFLEGQGVRVDAAGFVAAPRRRAAK